jgi:hypothetical protein
MGFRTNHLFGEYISTHNNSDKLRIILAILLFSYLYYLPLSVLFLILCIFSIPFLSLINCLHKHFFTILVFGQNYSIHILLIIIRCNFLT